MEKLKIENFNGIKYAEFEVKPFNLIIGPQSSGKSLCMKLLYFFREVMDRTFNHFHYSYYEDFKVGSEILFKNFFNPISETNIKYSNGDFKTFIKVRNGSITQFDATKDILTRSFEFGEKIRSKSISLQSIEYFKQTVIDEYNIDICPTQYVISNRNYFSLIDRNPYNHTEAVQNFDFIMNRYGSKLRENISFFTPLNIRSKVVNAMNKVLNGMLIEKNEHLFIKHNDGRTVKISSTSSGQQSAYPLFVFINRFLLQDFKMTSSLFVEEPEAHLYPTAQKEIMNLLVYMLNQRNGQNELFITTHSPYILSYLNVLMEAYRVKSPKIIEEDFWLNPDCLNPMAFNEEGVLVNIFDQETGLINAEAFDKSAEEIDTLFSQLLESDIND